MDDLELEARLRTRLHNRFDDAPSPVDLAANVRQAVTTAPARVRFDLRSPERWLSWSAVAAAVVLAVVVVTLGTLVTGPATPRATAIPTPAPTAAAWRWFIVLPPGDRPDKPDSSVAADVLHARVQALRPSNLMEAVGNAIVFSMPAEGPSDDLIRTVLSATGDVEFVPVPIAAFESLQPEVGDVLPADLAALFGGDGIVSVERTVNQQGIDALDLVLTPAAAEAFGDFTTEHQGEYLAITIDGRIATMPIINEPIPGGKVQISGGATQIPGRPNLAWEAASAILVGGRLPQAWRGARVPAIVTEAFARTAVAAQFPGASIEQVDLLGELDGDRWLAVWSVVISRDDLAGQPVPCLTPGPSGNGCPEVGPTRQVVIDAERGSVLRIEIPAD